MRVIALYFKVSILNELQYRVNFFVQVLQSFLSLVVALGGLVIVFDHTESLNGWTSAELLAVVGVYFIVGGLIGSLIQPSMQMLMEDIRQGTLDFAILKPVDTQLLVSVRQIQLWRLMDVGIGIVLLVIGLTQAGAEITVLELLAFVVMLIAGGIIVYSFWLILATIAFWFIRIDNILQVFQSMYEAGRWPVRIYPPWLQFMLTFLVPVAFAVTVPVEALTGRLTPLSFLGAIALTVLMFTVGRVFWTIGIRAYSGASA
ncbi:MAG: ABC-2 family transporter protein [Anaerolineae bacterium]|jgi:ABC-2 type transport system permease protein|nr:ABC-2 family transporter protein [Anaerolineae bacterium]